MPAHLPIIITNSSSVLSQRWNALRYSIHPSLICESCQLLSLLDSSRRLLLLIDFRTSHRPVTFSLLVLYVQRPSFLIFLVLSHSPLSLYTNPSLAYFMTLWYLAWQNRAGLLVKHPTIYYRRKRPLDVPLKQSSITNYRWSAFWKCFFACYVSAL